MEELKREQLLELGFRVEYFDGEFCLILVLNKGNDRFHHQVRWYEDEPEVFYIDCLKTSGWETIDEDDFFSDTNGLSSNAVKHYKEILKRLNRW